MNKQIIDRLNELAEANGGRITPDEVVAEARQKNSPLHEYFAARECFDQKKAAAHWCVAVARELIRSVRVDVVTENFTVKAPQFVRDPSAGQKQGYTSLGRLRSDAELAREVLVDEFSRAGAALARAKAVAAALAMSDEVADLHDRVVGLRTRIAEASPDH